METGAVYTRNHGDGNVSETRNDGYGNRRDAEEMRECAGARWKRCEATGTSGKETSDMRDN